MYIHPQYKDLQNKNICPKKSQSLFYVLSNIPEVMTRSLINLSVPLD